MNGKVYKVTNKVVDGKVYIGATSRSLAVRASEHKSQALNGSNSLLHKAIREYGWENFSFEIIENCDSRKELFESEAYWIRQYEANIFGYNASAGYGSTGVSPNHKGQKNPNSRLSEAEAVQIKILLMDRSMNQFEIAELYGISHKTVSHINCGRLWSSISVEIVA